MKKHKHYQVMRAHADGWEIEMQTNSGSWSKTFEDPCFMPERRNYRIVPDKGGWIPFYAHEESECPVDLEQRVEVQHARQHADNWMFAGKAYETVWTDDGFHNVIRYRLYELKTKKLYQWVVTSGSRIIMTPGFYESEADLKTKEIGEVIQRADWTMIEVEE